MSAIFQTIILGLILALAESRSMAAINLPVPTRPTTFPLSRPALAGEIIAWGTNTVGQISVPKDATNIVAIAAGPGVSMALRSDGAVFAWGYTSSGVTTLPPGLNDVVAIGLSSYHALALRSNGTVVGWGSDSYSKPPDGLSEVVAIATGYYSSLALKRNGTVVGWGQNEQGQLAIPAEATNIVAIAAGRSASFAIRGDGTVLRWGNYYFGPVQNAQNVVAISAPTDDSARILTLRRDGSVIDGSQNYWNLPLNLKAISLAQSYSYNIAITPERTVKFWKTYSDQVTTDGVTNLPPRLRNVIAIAAGTSHMLAVQMPSDPIPTVAVASPQIVNGFIIALKVVDGGEGYVVPPQVTITGGGGSGATATAQISKGVVTGFTMIKAGINYTGAPTITIEPPPPTHRMEITPSRVNVVMQVVPGKKYQLESTDNFPDFSPVGPPFVATAGVLTNEFKLSDTGQFFQIQEVP